MGAGFRVEGAGFRVKGLGFVTGATRATLTTPTRNQAQLL